MLITSETMNLSGIPVIRAGTVTLTAALSARPVSFSAPMPNANYSVQCTINNGVSVALTVASKTVNGFTIATALAVGVTIDWQAIGYA